MEDDCAREDELCELSNQDTGELLTFLEKRRWFEEKLKVRARADLR